MRPTIVPGVTEKLTSSTARTPPYCTVTPVIVRVRGGTRSRTSPAAGRVGVDPRAITSGPRGASNGPTEGLNLSVKQVKRCGQGFRHFEHYRLRVLLHTGGITWPARPSPPRIRTRRPHSNA